MDTAVLCDTLATRLNAVVRTLPGENVLLAVRHGRALHKQIGDSQHVHVFGLNALMCALCGGVRRVIYSPVKFPSRSEINWLRAVMNYRRVDIVCPSRTVQRAMVSRGVGLSRTHVVRPGVSLGDFKVQRDDTLRAALGYTPDDKIIFAPQNSDRAAGLSLATWAVSLLNVLDRRHRLLTAVPASQADIIDTFRTRLINKTMLHNVTDMSMQKLFSVADVVLFTPTHDAGVSDVLLTMAMACGRPIVATALPRVCELIEDRHTALLVRDASPRRIARRLVDCFSDSTQAWKIADRARAEVYDHFTRTRMLADLQHVYATVASGDKSGDR
jgi:glycosyltransferase involved in cell wall biosynthesis